MERKTERTIFLTGATGLVGGNLIPRLLKRDRSTRLLLLVRGDSQKEAGKRAAEYIHFFAPDIPEAECRERITVLRGDITQNRLGLSDTVHRELAQTVTHIIHSAATVKFQVARECAQAVNGAGTKNVIALAHQAQASGNLQGVAHISTAYVCGNRTGTFYENELDLGQQFANYYEETKFEAERFVRERMAHLPITIFRPSIIVGDSRTGKTGAFNTLYFPLRLIHAGLLPALPGLASNPLDVVSVDFVCEAIHHIFFNDRLVPGRTYHLTAGQNNAVAAGEVVRLAQDFFGHREKMPVRFMGSEWRTVIQGTKENGTARIVKAMEAYAPYLSVERSFDNAGTQAALRGTAITSLPFQAYYEKILGYCLETDWGKTVRKAV